MIGVIIAAGHSRRMGTLTKLHPKCMLPINGRPLLHHTIDRLRGIGCEEIVVIVGYKSDGIDADGCSLVKNDAHRFNNVLHSLMTYS